MRRWFAAAGVVAIVGLSLSACYFGPDPVQFAALTVVDGRPTAVVAVCGESTVDLVVYRDDNATDGPLYEWSVTVSLPNQVRDVEVELLGAPRAGWKITSNEEEVDGTGMSSFTVSPLTSIEPGHHYTLDSSEGGPEGSSAPAVTFTTDDFPRIGAGQVLAPVDHKTFKVVSRESFVNERCH